MGTYKSHDILLMLSYNELNGLNNSKQQNNIPNNNRTHDML